MTTDARPAPGAALRSLADDLRARTDAELETLLARRPDLLAPVPTDLSVLATRASTRASVQRALDGVDAFVLQVLEVCCVLDEPFTAGAVAELLGADPARGLRELRDLGVVWGDADDHRLLRSARELVGDPAGLGPSAATLLPTYGPARLGLLLDDLGLARTGDPVTAARSVADHLADPRQVQSLVDAIDPAARAVLERLTWGPPSGRVEGAHRAVTVATAQTPVDRLLARGLLVAGASDSVVLLPREVGLFLRGGHVHRTAEPEPPAADVTSRPARQVAATAAAAAFTTLRLVEDLLDEWGLEPPPVLRSGGLGVRELRRAAATIDTDEATLALLLEVVWAAGLLAAGGDAEHWLPTPAFDAWREQEAADRWVALAAAWVTMARAPSLVGGRDERDRVRTALAAELTVSPEMRLGALAELMALPVATAPTADSVVARLGWSAPHRPPEARRHLVSAALREAESLGLTGLGALAPYARPLVADALARVADGGDDHVDRHVADEVRAALAPLLPVPLDHVLLQADLTAVAPGPLRTELARELRLVADVESTGGATVYRFTDASVRRALDAGRSASDVHELLAKHSRTPVPQPLTYLVDDVARRHGRIRVGTASAYVRSDDAGVLAEIVADRRSAPLRLRRLAPTVLAAQASPDEVLTRLRTMGYAPAGEGADGDVVVRRPDAARAADARRLRRRESSVPGAPMLTAAVRALRAGDRATVRRPLDATGAPALLTRTAPATMLGALRSAAESGRSLWIGYVDNHGGTSERVVEPLAVQNGVLRAFDHRVGRVESFAVHRISGYAELDAEPA